MRREIGTRVLAISHGDETSLYSFGEGVYEGDFIPHEAVGWMAESAVEVGLTNPRIRLDSGEVVYGCECWWGPVEEVKERYGDRKFVQVSIEEKRAQYRKDEEKSSNEQPKGES